MYTSTQMAIQELILSLADFFKREKIEYAVIGAFALSGYGYIRATQDIDFITRLAYQGKICNYLEKLGFETTHRSEAFSNHVHPVGEMRIDFMYVEGSTADTILADSKNALVLKEVALPVVSADHLIALKLFAAQSNPERKFKELSDIKEIISRAAVNKEKIHEYFAKYGFTEYYEEIAKSRRP